MDGDIVNRRRNAAVVTLASLLATLFVLQAMRMSVASTIVVLDQANRLEIVRTILLGFVCILAGGVWRRRLGVWRGAGVALALLTGVRVAMQLASDRPEALVWLGAAAVATWGWTMLALLDGSRPAAGFGMMLTMVVDVALRSVLWSVDLGWMSNGPRLAVMLALAAVAFAAAVSAFRTTTEPESSELSGLPLLAIGPALGRFLAYGGSFGVSASWRTDEFPTIVGLLAVAVFAAVSWVYGFRRAQHRLGAFFGVSILLAAVISLAPTLSVIGSAMLIGLACFGDRLPVRKIERGATIWLTVGMSLQILLLAQYYSWTAKTVFLVPLAVLAVVGAAGAGLVRSQGSVQAWERNVRPALIASGLVLVLAWGWVLAAWEDFPATAPLPPAITVMTWNLQTGFALDQVFDMEAQAQVIEAADPDVLLLQEVTRGWAVSASVDQVTWLGRRLGMRVYFGPVSGDGSWGNAILTNATVRSWSSVHFSDTVDLDRGAVKVVIANGDADVTVIATHLDDAVTGSAERQTQVAELLEFWGGAPHTIIAGDFNTTPETPEIVQIVDAGLADTGASLPPEVETYIGWGRLDYIFVTPDLSAGDIMLGTGWESDHRSLTTEIVTP